MPSTVSPFEATLTDGSVAPASADALPEETRRHLLATVLESSPVLFCVFNLPAQKLVYLNKAGADRLNPGGRGDVRGLTLADFIGLSLMERLQAEMLPQARVLGRWMGECELRDVWGSEFMVSAVLSAHRPRRAGGGRDEFLCLHAQDLSVARSGNETQFADRELLHALLENSPDSVYFKDEASRFVRVSRAKSEKHGFVDARDIIGKTDFDLFSIEHASRAFADEQRIFRTGEAIIDQEEKLTWADGRVTWASSTKLPLHDPAGNCIGTFGISRDITARKHAEAQHREMEVQLQLAQKLESIGRLAAGVAHEINTPTQFITDNTRFLIDAFAKLDVVRASHQALQEAAGAHGDCAAALQAVAAAETEAELDYLTGEIPRCLQQSLEGLARVARIVRSLKEFAHPNSPDLTPADLNRVIETAVAVSRHEWKYVAEIVTEFDPELPLVPCVVDEFNQVLLNLIINSAHAIGDALKLSGEARGKITVRTRRDGPWAVVEVADTGTGMTPEVRQRIFEPFFTTKACGKGTGQGLAIVQAIMVKSHHGTVEVQTAPGQGTTFVLRLPLAVPPSPLSEHATTPPTPPP